MSPIGRIFVVINLALAGLFLGWAASNLATAQKYRNVAEMEVNERVKLKATLDSEIASLNAAKAEAVRIREEIKNQKDALETEKVALEQDIASKTDELNQLKTNVGGIDERLGDMIGQLESMNGQVEQANNERVAAVDAKRTAENERSDAVEAQAAAETRANELEGRIADLETMLNSTRMELQTSETQLAAAVAAGGLSIAELGGAAPPIDGAVLQVATNVKPGLVHINRGAADSVKAGFVFDLYQGATYKGQARVEIVNQNTCTARILNTVDGTTIAQGDKATTRI